MTVTVEGEELFPPEVFARAKHLVWHYGLFSITNDKSQDLKDRWFEEFGEDAGCVPRDVRPTRILVLAGRSLFKNAPVEVCDVSCTELPESPFKPR